MLQQQLYCCHTQGWEKAGKKYRSQECKKKRKEKITQFSFEFSFLCRFDAVRILPFDSKSKFLNSKRNLKYECVFIL